MTDDLKTYDYAPVTCYIPPADQPELVDRLFCNMRGSGRPPVWMRPDAPEGLWLPGTFGRLLSEVRLEGYLLSLVLDDPSDPVPGLMGREWLAQVLKEQFPQNETGARPDAPGLWRFIADEHREPKIGYIAVCLLQGSHLVRIVPKTGREVPP